MTTGWEGLGARLQQAMKDKGFVNRKGDADVTLFALMHGWLPNYVYRWIKDQSTPERANLDRLGEALGVAPAWLLFGDAVEKKPSGRRARKVVS